MQKYVPHRTKYHFSPPMYHHHHRAPSSRTSHRRFFICFFFGFPPRHPSAQAPYRNGAIGTRLLQHALNEGSADSFIVDAYLHVQTNNDDAITFYKRFGFVTDQVVQNYYKRLDPSDAVILKLPLKEWKVRRFVPQFFDVFFTHGRWRCHIFRHTSNLILCTVWSANFASSHGFVCLYGVVGLVHWGLDE